MASLYQHKASGAWHVTTSHGSRPNGNRKTKTKTFRTRSEAEAYMADNSLVHPVVICPTLDDATIDATLWLITELRSDGFSVEQVAETAAEHLADAVALYGTERNRHLQLVEARAMQAAADAAQVVPDDYDPTDAELRQSFRAEGWSERNAAVLRLVADIESGAVA